VKRLWFIQLENPGEGWWGKGSVFSYYGTLPHAWTAAFVTARMACADRVKIKAGPRELSYLE
jgi:hypothetical protein